MLVNVSFDDEEAVQEVDIIEIPDMTGGKLDELQREFLLWLFNKENNHEYWIEVDGEKIGCSYGSEAFVKWLNLYVIQDKRARIKAKNVMYLKNELPIIYF